MPDPFEKPVEEPPSIDLNETRSMLGDLSSPQKRAALNERAMRFMTMDEEEEEEEAPPPPIAEPPPRKRFSSKFGLTLS